MAHWHTVRQGESLPSIAERYGFANWNVIYDHEKNGDFRRQRLDPYVLAPGDQLFIPNKEQKYVEVTTEEVHRFQLKRQVTWVELVLEATNGTVYANKKYQFKVGDVLLEGNTDVQGLFREQVPAIAETGELTVWYDDNDPDKCFVWALDIGHLDPVEAVTGVQARLNNLGFPCGAVDGQLGEQTRASLRLLQRSAGLEETGEPDDQTRQVLVDKYGY